MFTTRNFTKHVPVVTGVVFDLTGSFINGSQLYLENMDSNRVVTYFLEDSPDGATYTRIAFANGGNTNVFALSAGATHIVKVTSTAPHVRLQADGDADVAFTITTSTLTNTGTTPITIS